MKQRAFTLLEIMIVVVILGVLTGLALPRVSRTVEQNTADVAKQQLDIIITTIKLLQENNKSYKFCGMATSAPCDFTDDVNAAIKTEIYSADFNFDVHYNGESGKWSIIAKRLDGPKEYELLYDGLADEISCSGDEGACDLINM